MAPVQHSPRASATGAARGGRRPTGRSNEPAAQEQGNLPLHEDRQQQDQQDAGQPAAARDPQAPPAQEQRQQQAQAPEQPPVQQEEAAGTGPREEDQGAAAAPVVKRKPPSKGKAKKVTQAAAKDARQDWRSQQAKEIDEENIRLENKIADRMYEWIQKEWELG